MHDPIFLDILGILWLYVSSIITPKNLVFHPIYFTSIYFNDHNLID